jgi:hypothetical protein
MEKRQGKKEEKQRENRKKPNETKEKSFSHI